jgi:hypothetical protein
MSKQHPQNGPAFSKRRSLTKAQAEKNYIIAGEEAKRKARLDPKYKLVTKWDTHVDAIQKHVRAHSGYIPPSAPVDPKLLVRRTKTRSPETITLRGSRRRVQSEEDEASPSSRRDLDEIIAHYENRCAFSNRLNGLFDQHDKNPSFVEAKFLDLALGFVDPVGNDVAVRYKLGEKIRSAPDAARRIFKFAKHIRDERPKPQAIIEHITRSNIKYFGLSVGSELAMMLCPNDYWAVNLFIMWACEYGKHCTTERANQILDQHHESYGNRASFGYHCADFENVYPKLKRHLDKIGTFVKAPPNAFRNIWNDAVAIALFDRLAPKVG